MSCILLGYCQVIVLNHLAESQVGYLSCIAFFVKLLLLIFYVYSRLVLSDGRGCKWQLLVDMIWNTVIYYTSRFYALTARLSKIERFLVQKLPYFIAVFILARVWQIYPQILFLFHFLTAYAWVLIKKKAGYHSEILQLLLDRYCLVLTTGVHIVITLRDCIVWAGFAKTRLLQGMWRCLLGHQSILVITNASNRARVVEISATILD